jgi:hypothetical protein
MATKTENATYSPIGFAIMEFRVASSQEFDIVARKGCYGKLIIEKIKFEEKM